MRTEPNDHPANMDEADRHARARHVPWWLAAGIAVLVVLVLWYFDLHGIER